MINYIAHWDQILIQSRSKIIHELSNFEFRSICPIVEENELKKHYSETLNWKISRERYFDLSAVFSLRKILKNFDDGSVFHIFTLKTGFMFMISNLFLNKNFKSTLSITGLGYFFSKNSSAKIFKILLRPIFLILVNFLKFLFRLSNSLLCNSQKYNLSLLSDIFEIIEGDPG